MKAQNKRKEKKKDFPFVMQSNFISALKNTAKKWMAIKKMEVSLFMNKHIPRHHLSSKWNS